MTTTADTTQIAELVESLKERLGPDDADTAPAARGSGPRSTAASPGDAPHPAGHRRPSSAWNNTLSIARTAVARREIQLAVLAAVVLATVGETVRRRRR